MVERASAHLGILGHRGHRNRISFLHVALVTDFDIIDCSFCQAKHMRTNFSWCRDCDKPACAHTEVNCGIDCPCCDWFICGSCVIKHSVSCWKDWKRNNEVQIEVTEQDTVYTFHQEEKTKLDDQITIFSNEHGVTQIKIGRQK
jgi:hypothetical protein